MAQKKSHQGVQWLLPVARGALPIVHGGGQNAQHEVVEVVVGALQGVADADGKVHGPKQGKHFF